MASSDAAGVGIKSEIFIFLDLFKKNDTKGRSKTSRGTWMGRSTAILKRAGLLARARRWRHWRAKCVVRAFVSPFEQIMVSAKIFMSVCSGIKVAVPLISTKDVYLMCACGVPPDSWKEDLTEDP